MKNQPEIVKRKYCQYQNIVMKIFIIICHHKITKFTVIFHSEENLIFILEEHFIKKSVM